MHVFLLQVEFRLLLDTLFGQAYLSTYIIAYVIAITSFFSIVTYFVAFVLHSKMKDADSADAAEKTALLRSILDRNNDKMITKVKPVDEEGFSFRQLSVA